MAESIPDAVRRFRAAYREKEIGPLYRGWMHFGFTTLGSLAVIAFAISRVSDVRRLEWLSIPLTFLFANVAEYFGHKGPMHQPTRGLSRLFLRHTREHHHFFTHDAMAYESTRDFKMVLFPPVMLFFFLGVIATPIALLLFWLSTPNAAWLYVATAMSYFLAYEWLHFAYHLDEKSAFGGAPFLRALRRHHQSHHDKALMGRWNFNITFPIADVLCRTYYRNGATPADKAGRAPAA